MNYLISFKLFENIEPLVKFDKLEKITQEVRNILVDLNDGYVPYKVKNNSAILPQITIRIGGDSGDSEYKIKIDDYIEELYTIDRYLESEGFTLSTLNHLYSDLESAIKTLSGREIIGITLYYEFRRN